jgi:hypothetical protein
MSKLEISEDTIRRTTKCHSNFHCLNDAENPKCPVEADLGSGLVIVNFNNASSCNYSIPFEIDKIICHCPVRYEIYKHYRM